MIQEWKKQEPKWTKLGSYNSFSPTKYNLFDISYNCLDLLRRKEVKLF